MICSPLLQSVAHPQVVEYAFGSPSIIKEFEVLEIILFKQFDTLFAFGGTYKQNISMFLDDRVIFQPTTSFIVFTVIVFL